MSLRNGILKLCFEDHRDQEIRFASGKPANNKLDTERIENSILRGEVIYQIVRIIDESLDFLQPDLIVPVPNGANWLGRAVAKEIGCQVLLLEKDEETKEISLPSGGKEVVEESEIIVIVEDVLNELTNSGKVFRLPGVEEKTDLIVGIWDRNPERGTWLPVDVEAVVKEPIPLWLPDESPLWEYAA